MEQPTAHIKISKPALKLVGDYAKERGLTSSNVVSICLYHIFEGSDPKDITPERMDKALDVIKAASEFVGKEWSEKQIRKTLAKADMHKTIIEKVILVWKDLELCKDKRFKLNPSNSEAVKK